MSDERAERLARAAFEWEPIRRGSYDDVKYPAVRERWEKIGLSVAAAVEREQAERIASVLKALSGAIFVLEGYGSWGHTFSPQDARQLASELQAAIDRYRQAPSMAGAQEAE